MKQLLLFVFVSLIMTQMADCQEVDSGVPAITNVRNAEFPKIHFDKRVTFQINAPDAVRVEIDLEKKYTLNKNDKGIWSVTTEPVSGGFHYYSVLIDGVALADPASETFYGMSRLASGIEIPYQGRDYYALRDVPHGDVRIKRYYSKVTNSWRRFYIYTPPGYDEKIDQDYPVLYLLHGGGEDERGWAMQGNTDLILDNLIADGKAKSMLIVMVDGNVDGLTLEESYLKSFEKELLQSVIPFVEKQYRTKKDSANRALAGLSLGGLQTLYAGVPNTHLFNYLGVFSSGWIMPSQKAMADNQYYFMAENTAKINNNLNLFWISMGGKEDIAYQNCQLMMAKFDEIGINYKYSESPGGHTWPVWRHDLYHFAQLIFK